MVIFFSLFQTDANSEDGGKRKRQQTQRYGESAASLVNKDHFFDGGTNDSPNSTASLNDDSNYADDTDTTSTQAAVESQETNSINVSQNQASRIEAKVDLVYDVVKQIQRIIVSISNGKGVAVSNQIPKLPLSTKDSMDKFETDLNDDIYRQLIVR